MQSSIESTIWNWSATMPVHRHFLTLALLLIVGTGAVLRSWHFLFLLSGRPLQLVARHKPVRQQGDRDRRTSAAPDERRIASIRIFVWRTFGCEQA
jgi:hypothetical protein